jgi:transcriptional regulator with XRE-family HTH domain
MDGQDLKRRRDALGLSQKELGLLLGVMQNTVSRWELGLVVIRHPKILALALERISQGVAARNAAIVRPGDVLKDDG